MVFDIFQVGLVLAFSFQFSRFVFSWDLRFESNKHEWNNESPLQWILFLFFAKFTLLPFFRDEWGWIVQFRLLQKIKSIPFSFEVEWSANVWCISHNSQNIKTFCVFFFGCDGVNIPLKWENNRNENKKNYRFHLALKCKANSQPTS